MGASDAAVEHEPALTGLRAVAVVSVIVYHIGQEYVPGLLVGGWAGVDLFFVLSGFLITTILQREQASGGRIDIRGFYARRARRLMPAYLPVLIAALVIAVLLPVRNWDALRATLVAATYGMNWYMAFGGAKPFLLAHTWSLAAEVQFYALWPLVFVATATRYRFPLTLALIALIALGRCWLVWQGADTHRTYAGFDTRADALLIGCALAMRPIRVDRAKASLTAIVVIASVAIVTLLRFDTRWTQSIGLSVTALVMAGLVIGARSDGPLRALLSSPPVVYVGRISYGLYLWHYPLLLLWGAWMPTWSLPLAVIITVGLAMASHHYIEMPVARVRRPRSPSPRAMPSIVAVKAS